MIELVALICLIGPTLVIWYLDQPLKRHRNKEH